MSQHKQELGGRREQGVDKKVDTAPQAQRGGETERREVDFPMHVAELKNARLFIMFLKYSDENDE